MHALALSPPRTLLVCRYVSQEFLRCQIIIIIHIIIIVMHASAQDRNLKKETAEGTFFLALLDKYIVRFFNLRFDTSD